jgi:hypothetical protein
MVFPKFGNFGGIFRSGVIEGVGCRIYPACGAKPHQGEFAVGTEP